MMNIDKLREAWLHDNPKIFCFSNIFNFVQFCWAHKFTPYNSAGHQKNRKRDWRKICKYKYDFTSYL